MRLPFTFSLCLLCSLFTNAQSQTIEYNGPVKSYNYESASSGDCYVGNLVVDFESSICPDDYAIVSLSSLEQVPQGGGLGIQFLNVETQEAINITSYFFPAFINNDLDGLLTFYGVDPFEGEYEITAFVYSDLDDFPESICSSSETPDTIIFLGEDDPECEGETCYLQSISLDGPESVCPEGTTTISVNDNTIFPDGGGLALTFFDVNSNQEIITITDVPNTYTFDNDLNGELSLIGLGVLEGDYSITPHLYTDINDVSGSICDSANPRYVSFLNDTIPPCSCELPTLVLEGPQSFCAQDSSSVNIIGEPEIPEGGGMAIQFLDVENQVLMYFVDLTFPFWFNSDMNGALSEVEYPAFLHDCEITLFTYFDPANPLGSICDETFDPLQVFFLDENDPNCEEINLCEAGNISAPDGLDLCPDDTKIISNDGSVEIPNFGGYRLIAYTGTNQYVILIDDPNIDYIVDNDLGGIVSNAGDDPLLGNVTFVAQSYSYVSNPEYSICDESSGLTFTFYAGDDSFCINGIEDLNNADSWSLYPNPAQNEINIKLNATGISEVNISIYDISGRLVYEESNRQLEGGNLKVNIANLNQGAYQVMLSNQDFKSTKPLLISK